MGSHESYENSELGEPEKISRRDFLRKSGKVALGLGIASTGLNNIAHAGGQSTEKEPNLEDKELRDIWEKYKGLILSSEIKENLKEIERHIGEKVKKEFFTAFFSLRLADQLIETERKGIDIIADEHQRKLVESAVEEYKFFWSEVFITTNAEKAYQETIEEPVTFSGFENLPGMTNEQVQKLLEDKYDKRWLYGNVSKYEYSTDEKHLKTYQVAGEARGEGQGGVYFRSGQEKIVVYAHNGIKDEESFMKLLSHEIGHHHDWDNTNALTISERVTFLKELLERLLSDDRFHSDYVDHVIPNEHNDKSKEEILIYRAKEQWAELVEQYDTRPTAFKETKQKDYDFVDKWKCKIIERYGNE